MPNVDFNAYNGVTLNCVIATPKIKNYVAYYIIRAIERNKP